MGTTRRIPSSFCVKVGIMLVLYVLSFWTFVALGHHEMGIEGYEYLYLGPRYVHSPAEAVLVVVYYPAYEFFRQLGVNVVYVGPGVTFKRAPEN